MYIPKNYLFVHVFIYNEIPGNEKNLQTYKIFTTNSVQCKKSSILITQKL